MATLDNDDLKAIKNLLEVTMDKVIEEKLVTKDIIEQLLTKNDLYKKMDEFLMELKGV